MQRLTSHTHASRLNESLRVLPFSKWRMSMRRALMRGHSAWGACSQIASSQIQEYQRGGIALHHQIIRPLCTLRTAQGRCREGGGAMEIEWKEETSCPTPGRRQKTWNTQRVMSTCQKNRRTNILRTRISRYVDEPYVHITHTHAHAHEPCVDGPCPLCALVQKV